MGQKTERIFEHAEVSLKENADKEALRLFNEVLNREPRHLQSLRYKATLKIKNETRNEAKDFLLRAIKRQPKDDQLRQMLGSLYVKAQKPEEAIAMFKRSLEFNASNTLAHRGLGILYAKVKNDHKKAVYHFSKVIKIENTSTSADIFFNRGCSYMILKQLEKAKKDLKKADKLGHSAAAEMVDIYFS